jgi:cell division septation protein DedD
VGVVANLKNRFVLGWVVISLLLNPFIPLLILIFLSKLEEITTYTYNGPPDLNNEFYVIYLTKKYNIEKIDTLNKFSCQGKTFEDSQAVLKYVDDIEKKSIPIAISKKREEPENIDGKCPVCSCHINLKDEICWKCDASFSSTSLYKPVVLDSLELENINLKTKLESKDVPLQNKWDVKYLVYFFIPILLIIFLFNFTDKNDKNKKQNQSEIQKPTEIKEPIKIDTSEVIDNSKITIETPQEIKNNYFYIGQTVNSKYFDVTVNHASTTSRINPNWLINESAGSGNQFLVLNITIKNTNSESRFFNEGSLLIKINEKALKFDKTEFILSDGFITPFTSINPLITLTGNIVYKIPDDYDSRIIWVPGRDDKAIVLSNPPQKKTTNQPFLSEPRTSASNIDNKYWVQIGSFLDKNLADELKNQYLNQFKNIEVYEGTNQKNNQVWRVRIGPYKNKDETVSATSYLKNINTKYIIISPNYWIQFGSFFDKSKADNMKDDLKNIKNINVYEGLNEDDKTVWRVRAGPFISEEDAKGFSSTFNDSNFKYFITNSDVH